MIRIWHPMRDAHHCCFRLLAIRSSSNVPLSVARLSILDTFLLFPEFLREIRYTGFGALRGELSALNISKKDDSFVSIPDIKTVYRELQVFQKSAFSQLVARNLFDKDDYSYGNIEIIREAIPVDLSRLLSVYLDENRQLLNFLSNRLSAVPLDGPDGLLRRTGLELGGRLR